MPLAPPEVRRVTNVINVEASTSANNMFERGQTWLARDHSETKLVVSHVDMNHLRILAKADMYCNASLGSGLRSMGLGVNVSRLTFNIDFLAKNGSASITYDELYYYLQDMRYQATKYVQGPSNSVDVNTLYTECILPLHEEFVRHISSNP